MPADEPSTSDMLEHAWRYFSLHASQRMSMFNFFLIVSGSITAGLSACLQFGGVFHFVGVGLGLLLGLVSFVFAKLDQRTSFLVKLGESAMIALETSLTEPQAQVFLIEPEFTKSTQKEQGILTRMWTYGESFRFVFLVMGVVGMAGAVLCGLSSFEQGR